MLPQIAEIQRQLEGQHYITDRAIATTVYVAVALGVFGTLTVDEVISSGGTAIAVAAEPVLGSVGYWLITVTALCATAGATNSGLYPAAGLGSQMADVGQFPPVMGRRLGGRAFPPRRRRKRLSRGTRHSLAGIQLPR